MCAVQQSLKALTTDLKKAKQKALKKVLTNAMLKWLSTCLRTTNQSKKLSSTRTFPWKGCLNCENRKLPET